MNLKAVLFDLDGTLLDIDIDNFISQYFEGLSAVIARVTECPDHRSQLLSSIHAATAAMMKAHDGETNQEVFTRVFAEESGLDLADIWSAFDDFYAQEFPTLIAHSGPMEGAPEVVRLARDLSLRTAIATNPMFPRIAVLHRMNWAQISPEQVDLITTFETMKACKPHPGYFIQTAQMLGVEPQQCIMVGDDPRLDLAAADVGMTTFFVGDSPSAVADYRGDLIDLQRLLVRLSD